MDAFNRRDLDGFLAVVASAEGRYEDRRKGLRDAGSDRDRGFARALFFEAASELASGD